MSKDIKLIALDLDGTTLDSGSKITDENLRTLEAASEKGIFFTTMGAEGTIRCSFERKNSKKLFLMSYAFIYSELFEYKFEKIVIKRCKITGFL